MTASFLPAGESRMTRGSLIGFLLMSLAIVMCGCRSQSAGRFSAAAPNASTSAGFRGFLPDAVRYGRDVRTRDVLRTRLQLVQRADFALVVRRARVCSPVAAIGPLHGPGWLQAMSDVDRLRNALTLLDLTSPCSIDRRRSSESPRRRADRCSPGRAVGPRSGKSAPGRSGCLRLRGPVLRRRQC